MKTELSLYLNLLRFLAALAVYLFHAQHFAKVRVPYVDDLGSEAVFVFFVLSGLLITYSGLKQKSGASFVRARLIRLWSVCLPALFVTAIADTVGQHLSLASYAPMQPYDAFKWVASIGINAVFLNQVWSANIYPGTNGPFWSLSYEFWYYMLFAAAIYCTGKKKMFAVVAAMLVAGPAILIGFPIWLMGAATYYAIKKQWIHRPHIGIALWLGSICLALACHAFDLHDKLVTFFPGIAANAKWKVDFWPESYLIGAIVALNILGFSVIQAHFKRLLQLCSYPIQLGADISFGLYLLHYPMMYLTKAVLNSAGWSAGPLFVAAVYALPFVISAVIALQCEKHKAVCAQWVDGVSAVVVRKAGDIAAFVRQLGARDPLLPRSIHDPADDDKLLF